MADLILENGTGVVNANAYLTTEEADEILEVNIHSNWTIADEETKEKLIIWATRLLEERVQWFGKKMFPTAWLSWPRCGARDREGYMLQDDIVPRQVKIATALLADHLLAGNPELVNSSSNLTSLKADVVELKFDAKLRVEKYPTEVKFALDGLGRVSMGRGGPKFIVRH
ncbi:hypothetical protein LAV_00011 [Sphingobium phage Lacusarx]|uniref:Putative DnaT-like domain-containing protein n=1 Tax=Sphingobium phage Lacusarx TaxID=1980139 RepID=A0A1W6DWZ3_9CAUD|nr:head-tail adaptor Ad1 [Sphingobium phage Lacusarx]ARK07411.1 hypothetical protein LAV_00011 [Sphingobium phage Lacusarx]